MIVIGLLSRFSIVMMPIDLKEIPISFLAVSYSLDVVLLVAGLFLILVSWVFHKLAQ